MSETTDSHWLHGIDDLLVVLALVLAFDLLVAVADAGGSALHLLLGLPALLFVPGYAVVAAMYPRASAPEDWHRPRSAATPARSRSTGSIGAAGRIGVSVAASVVVLAVVALAANATSWGIRTAPLLAGITLITLVAVTVAAYRRTGVAAHHRYDPSIPWRPVAGALRPRASLTFVLGVVMVASAVAAAAVIGGHAGPVQADSGEQFSEFSVLTDNDSDGYETGNYTEAIESDDPLYFGVSNTEGEPTDYTIVVVRESMARDGNDTVVAGATELDRLSVSLSDGETRRVEYDPEPVDRERPQRLRATLYRGDAPDTPTRASGYRTVQVWFDDFPFDDLEPIANGTETDEGPE